MNKLIIAAIVAGLSGNVFAGAGDVLSDAGNQDGTRVTSTNQSDGSDNYRREARQVFVSKSSAIVITGSQPEIGSARKYNPFSDNGMFSDAGNH